KEKLGSGGMGDVYLAEDSKLHRSIALKLLPADVSADPQRRMRFLQEAHAASVLNHPNVSTIYEVGETADTIFIAMEYIEGKTLGQIRETRDLAVDEVIDIGIQVADALDEAQARGIVHRDIKSGNIMLTARGHVKVLDFGLAKLTGALPQDDDSSTRIKTTPGLVVGTSYYMSPEQALGRPVDHRSDLFSLGVVLYELVTGRLPFVGSSTTETIEKITHEQPEPIARFNYSLPVELERIIRKLLEKDPSRRYQSARELIVDLKNLKRDTTSGEVRRTPEPRRARWVLPALLIAAVLVLSAAAVLLVGRRTGGSNPREAIDSVAVMPFVNTSQNPETEYLSDGISESIINNLSQISALRVVPRSTVFRYKGKELDLQKIAAELKVRAIVTGRVLQRGDLLTLQTELVDSKTNAQLWGARYERKVADALTLQEAVSQEISNALRVRLTGGEQQRVAQTPTTDGEAYQLYLKGRYHWNKRTAESLRTALGFFEQAVAKDRNFALAQVGMADTHLVMYQYADVPAQATASTAEAAVRRALAVDPRLPEAYASLGLIHEIRWEWKEAEAAFKRAIELNPNYPTAYHWYNILLRALDRSDESLAMVRKAQQLDPLSMIIGTNVVDVLAIKGDMNGAIAAGEKYLEIDPNFAQLLGRLSRVYSLVGRHAEALAAARKAVQLSGEVSEQLALLAVACVRAGEQAEAMGHLRTLEARERTGRADPAYIAWIYATMGDNDRAFEYLEKGFAKRSGGMRELKSDPSLGLLRPDPRFADLCRRMGLPV
ncbi:MAG TPA: protein kinase, partial [Thermoanaerobaculia bacterium]|nr:protein kinase [Thermoanaerobaculia bacterium]